MTEPDVALTDYGLAAECALFAYLLHRGGDPRWVVFFAAGAVASLAGGTVHGFFLDPATAGARLLWPVALLAVGVTAVAAWAIGGRLLLTPSPARAVEVAAAAAWLAYAALVLGGAQAFGLAVAAYLPAALFLLAGFVVRYRRTGERGLLIGALGLGVTFLAAAVQRAGHNAVHHGIQAGGLVLLFAAARHPRRAC